jgi:hypothetical protein
MCVREGTGTSGWLSSPGDYGWTGAYRTYFWRFGGGGYFYHGLIDELRISNTVRSAGWIATEYNNQSSPSTFLSEGSQENSGP